SLRPAGRIAAASARGAVARVGRNRRGPPGARRLPPGPGDRRASRGRRIRPGRPVLPRGRADNAQAMGPALAVADAPAKLGIVLAAAAVAAALVDRDARRRALWMGMSLVLAGVILVGHIENTDQFRSLTDRPLRFAGLCVAGILIVGILAVQLRRRPQAFPLVVVAVLPFRVPIEAAGQTSNLLVPLYLVIAGGVLSYAWRTWAAENGAETDAKTGFRPLEPALAAFLVLYALQATYSKDFDTALEQAVFFLIPFALLYALLREVRWSREVVLGCVGVLVLFALVFSAIGFWEYERRELFWNPKVIT